MRIVKKGYILGACILVFFLVTAAYAATYGAKKRRPKPHEYGAVVINNFSAKNRMRPVVFPHWIHRAKHTCRLCHVDIGFAMRAGGTEITEDDNKAGLYCGACHNGTVAFAPKETSAKGETVENCDRCHSYRKEGIPFKNDFYEFKKGMPQGRFGNGIDWLKAEDEGRVKLVDYLEGVSIRRQKLKNPEDIEISAKETGMPDIIFSHRKHAIWNGCELCHPEIFGVNRGEVKYTMQDIFDGKFCGACHDIVAFPNSDCQGCHTKPVF